jgi:hypothetical protein
MSEFSSSDFTEFTIREREGEVLACFDGVDALRGLVEVMLSDAEDVYAEAHGECETYKLELEEEFRLPDDALKSEAYIELAYIKNPNVFGTFSLTGTVTVRPERIYDFEKEVHFYIATHKGRIALTSIATRFPEVEDTTLKSALEDGPRTMTSFDVDELIRVFEAVLEFDDSDLMDR